MPRKEIKRKTVRLPHLKLVKFENGEYSVEKNPHLSKTNVGSFLVDAKGLEPLTPCTSNRMPKILIGNKLQNGAFEFDA